MAFLAENYYGKSRVRLMKVTRDGEQHQVREWTVGVYLQGEFTRCFSDGDNTGIMATDTMKNTVYSVARDSTATTMEVYACELARLIAERNPEAGKVRVTMEEKMWVRIIASGRKHGSSFLQRGPDVATIELVFSAGKIERISSGVRGLMLLKTGHSAFKGFHRDVWTTLPESDDRLLGTEATIVWTYADAVADYAETRRHLMESLLTCFAEHESLSVQHTLYAMAEAALACESAISEISLTMPNRHNLPVNLEPFGQSNLNEIFTPTDEPHGQIHARIVRAQVS